MDIQQAPHGADLPSDKPEPGSPAMEFLVEASLVPCVVLTAVRDAQGHIIDFVFADANQAACDFNLTTREELVGLRLLEQHPAAGSTDLLQRYIHIVETGQPLVLDDWSYPQDMLGGQLRRYDVRAVKVGDGLAQTWWDVTDRYLAEEALAASERQFRLLAENSADMVTQCSTDGTLTWVSPASERLLGWTPEELIGTKISALVHPDDILSVQSALMPIAGDQTWRFETRLLCRFGNYRWVAVTGRQILDASGARVGATASWRDIQAEMDARLRQKAIFSSSLEPHILLEPLYDETGRIIDFILLDMNDAALATMHTDRSHVIGLRTMQTVSQPAASEMVAAYREIYESGEPFVRDSCLWPLKTPILGRYFDIRAFKAGDLLSFSWRDVTDRILRQKRHEEAAAKLTAIIDAIPSLIWSAQPDGNLDFLNRAWLEYTGMTLEEAQGDGWIRALHPDDREEEERISAEARRTGRVFEVEERLLRHDGVYRWFLVRARPVRDTEGIITAWYGSNVDITDLKEAEASLRRTMASLNLAIEAAEIGVWVHNYLDASFVCDERIRRWYEVPEDVRDSRSLNAWLHKHLHPEDAPRMEARISNARLSGTAFQDEFRIIRGDGSIMHMQAAGLLETDAEGHPIAMIGIHRDITAQRTLEQNLVQERRKLEAAYAELQQHRDHLEDLVHARTRELAAARDAAEGADRAKSAFLGTISHEMRTPLNQIMGMAWLLGRSVTEGKPAHYVEAIHRASRSLLEMTSSLLDFVKVESDTIALKDVEFSLAALLDRVRTDSLDRTGKVGREVRSTVDPALPVIFKGDAFRLGQVLVALVGNALKFSESGPITIGVRKVAVLRDRFVVRFEVRDTGIGMTPEVQSELFTLFRQGDNSSTRRYGGLGLGLALAKRIVTLMAGEMGFSSEEGSGSLVWFTIQIEGMERASESSMASRVFTELEVLLAEEDFLAVTLWEESHTALEPFLGAAVGPLAEAIMSFDFMTAQKILREATKSLQG